MYQLGFFITSACILANISWRPPFWMPDTLPCFISFSHSLVFFHCLNFCLLVSTAFSTSSHHHQVSLCLHLLFVTPQTVAATSVIAFSTLSHCSSLSHCPQYLYSFLVTFLNMPSLPLVSSVPYLNPGLHLVQPLVVFPVFPNL